MKYNRSFYDWQQAGSLRSAEIIVPLLLNMVSPQRVVDVGCGVGTWLSVFKKRGVQDILGLDGGYVPQDMLLCPRENFMSVDLRSPVKPSRIFDLALSMEVAEHLPKESAEPLVRFLTQLAPVVVFSAAVPRQGGTDHINEQWPTYWVSLFKRNEYVVVDALRPLVWDNEKVEPWYRQNILLFVRESLLKNYPALIEAKKGTRENMLSVIHPKLFEHSHEKPLGAPAKIITWLLKRYASKFKKMVTKPW